MNLVAERPGAAERDRYRHARNNQALYTAATELWMHGVDMGKAIKIVKDAVKASS